jgi:Icc protein
MKPLTIVQITDTHLFADRDKKLLGIATWYSLENILTKVTEIKPDILLLTGDLADQGELLAYQKLAQLLTPLQIPTYWLPGNHDQPELMTKILNSTYIFPDKSINLGEWQLILLDSLFPQAIYGEGKLTPYRLQWLQEELTKTNKPILIALHHHPLPTGINWLDQISLQNNTEFIDLISSYSQVSLVIFGHIHLEFSAKRGNINYYGTPSSCTQVTPLNPESCLEWQQPGFRLLKLYPDGSHQTKVMRINL